MKRITVTDAMSVPPGSRVWVKEWDEVHRVVRYDAPGFLVTPTSVLNPSKLSIYLLTPGEPATGPAGVFYHVAQVNWL